MCPCPKCDGPFPVFWGLSLSWSSPSTLWWCSSVPKGLTCLYFLSNGVQVHTTMSHFLAWFLGILLIFHVQKNTSIVDKDVFSLIFQMDSSGWVSCLHEWTMCGVLRRAQSPCVETSVLALRVWVYDKVRLLFQKWVNFPSDNPKLFWYGLIFLSAFFRMVIKHEKWANEKILTFVYFWNSFSV